MLGVEVKFKGALYDVLICPSDVPELNTLSVTENSLIVGGAVTLTELGRKLQELIISMPGECTISSSSEILCLVNTLVHRTRVFSAMLEMLRWFAGQQIRNVSVSTLVTMHFDVELLLDLYIVFRRQSC